MRSIWVVEQCGCEAYMSPMAHHEKRLFFGIVFFQLYLPLASYIASQLYSASPSDIVLRIVKGKYNITETEGFNITFVLTKISLQRSWNINKKFLHLFCAFKVGFEFLDNEG